MSEADGIPLPQASNRVIQLPNLGSMVWLGLRDRIQVLAENIKRISRRMFEVPEFYFYAIADGISTLFVRHGRWNGLDGPDVGEDEEDLFHLKLAF